MAESKTLTRYERVQEILNQAAGESSSDYGGVGRFWELPVDQLLEVRVLGVRMIAPENRDAKPCCRGVGRGAGVRGGADPPGPRRAAPAGIESPESSRSPA